MGGNIRILSYGQVLTVIDSWRVVNVLGEGVQQQWSSLQLRSI